MGTSCVYMLDPERKLYYIHETPGKGPGGVHYPHGVVIDGENRLLIADIADNRICVLSRNGSCIGQIHLEKDDSLLTALTLTPKVTCWRYVDCLLE